MSKKTSKNLGGKSAWALFREQRYREASVSYARICRENNKDDDAWMMRGLCLQNLGLLEKAILFLEHAVSLNPRSTKAWNRLGLAWLQKGWVDQAIESFREALFLKRDYNEAHANLIKALLAGSRFQEAGVACREALQYAPESANLHCQLAVSLEQMHELEEAKAAARKALELDSGQVRANFILAKIEKRAGELRSARDRLQAMLQQQFPPVHLATFASELGDVLDRMGDYVAAYNSFEIGNAALAKTVTPAQAEQESIFKLIERHRQWFSTASTESWEKAVSKNSRPSPIFLVGFPRSGTTLTEQVLASLAQIVPSDEKPVLGRVISGLPELLGRPFRYPDDLGSLAMPELEKLRARYWTLVGGMIGSLEPERRLLDKLPLNLIELGMVYRLFPDAKVIVVLRDPRDCCLSCFMQPFQLNRSMINFLSLERSARFYAAVMDLWLHYRSVLKFQYMEMRYEDLVTDFEVIARKLVTFSGEPWDEKVLYYFKHTRNVSTPSYSAIASPIYSRSIGRWRHYQRQLRPIFSILEPYIELFGYTQSSER